MYFNRLDFVCDYCSRTFKRKNKLQTHIKSCHVNSMSHCNICEQSLGTPAGLQLHLSRGHNNFAQPFPECDICGRIFTRKQNIASHMITVHLQGLRDRIRCNLCIKTFTTERNLKRHMKWQHDPDIEYPSCYYCNKTFKGKHSLTSHIHAVHNIGEKNPKKCHLCDKIYTNTRNLKRHIEMFHGERGEYRCDICPRVYTSNQNLRRHLRTAHSTGNAEKFTCNSCSKIIIGKPNYESHIQYHHQSENENKVSGSDIVCETCHQMFEEECLLRQHIKKDHSFKTFYKYCKNVLLRQHESNFVSMVYNCEYCQHTFKSVYDLKNHMRVNHDTEYSLSTCNVCFCKFYSKETMTAHKRVCLPPANVNTCSHCDKLFTDITSLEFHTRIFHPQAQIADSNVTSSNIDEDLPTSFKCLDCDRVYYSDRSLKHHIKLKHTSDKQVECGLCGKICSNKYYLASHIKMVHNNDSWSRCEYCEKEFKSKRNIRRHIEYTHLGMQRYKCVECETLFKEKRSLRKHIRTKHPNSAAFPQCHICHKRFESAKSCKIHLKLLHSFNMNTYPCHLCSVSFSCNEALTIHLNTKHLADFQIYKCEGCNLVFKGQEQFDRHNLDSHSNVVSNVKQKVLPHCVLCMKDFSTRKTLKRHIKKFHNEFEVDELINFGAQQPSLSVDCEECIKNLSDEFHHNVYKMVKHLNDAFIFKCEMCHSSFNSLEYAIQRYKITNRDITKTKAILSELCTTEMSEGESEYSGFGSLHQFPESTTKDIVIKRELMDDLITEDDLKIELEL